MIAAFAAGLIARPWARTALRWGAVGLAVILFLLTLRRAGERAGRMAERFEMMWYHPCPVPASQHSFDA